MPLIREYKYLGIIISDDLQFKLHSEAQAEKEKDLSKIKWILQNKKLDGKTKWHIW